MVRRACNIITEEFKSDLKTALRKSKRNLDFINHGFTVWEEEGEFIKSDFVSGDVYINMPRKLDKQNVILLKTRSCSEPHFKPEDIIQINPFPESDKGSTKAVCIFIESGSNGILKCIEKTSACKDRKKQFELIDNNERIEQLYYRNEISREEAVLSMFDNLSEYIDTTRTVIPTGDFSISI